MSKLTDFIFDHIKTAIALVVLVVLTGWSGYIYYKGYTSCSSEYAVADLKSEVVHEKIKNKVQKLSDPELDRRLAKWVRPDDK